MYFVHGFYCSESNVQEGDALRRNQMILLKDDFFSIYDIDAYDVNLNRMNIREPFPQGEFIYYNGENFETAENNSISNFYAKLNRFLTESIEKENEENKPTDASDDVLDVYSYHINVGHGNCSIIVFGKENTYNMWMVDCSVFDFTNKHRHHINVDSCMNDIKNEFGIERISKLLITHLHYDHINGIEYFIKNGWIDKNTEVWMNTKYPWKQATYNRILIVLKGRGVKFIDPVTSNSTKHINILYPDKSFDAAHKAPDNNINNASVLYQICFNDNSMLFTGDIETEGWNIVNTCCPCLQESTYYCISHHGSITGHIRKKCYKKVKINTLADCAYNTELAILMGRDNAYKGVFSKKVLLDFKNIIKTEKSTNYIRIKWDDGTYITK